MTVATWTVLGVAFVASAVLTEVARRLAIVWGIVDHESPRSSHASVRPRGGGLAIVVAVPLAIAAGWLASGALPGRHSLIALATASGLSRAGLVDDVRRWSYKPKLAAQVVAAAVLVVGIGPATTIALPGAASIASWAVPFPLAIVLTAVAIVGFINAFNFIDGIDAIAGLQAVAGSAVLAFAALRANGDPVVAVALMGSTIGFLLHNRPPARVFMGDVGSQYLGCLLAGLALVAERETTMPASLAALVFLPVAADVVSTLIVRIAKRLPWHEAHRDHVYQQLVRRGWSHGRTTLVYGGLTLASGAGILLCTAPDGARGWVWWVLVLPTLTGIAAWRMSQTSRDMLAQESDTPP